MKANHTSTIKTLWRKFSVGMKQVGQSVFQFSQQNALPWCKDHSLPIAVLLAFPLALGTFYWGSDSPEPAPAPNPSQLSEVEEKPSDLPLQNGKAPVISVVPDYPKAENPPQLLNFSEHTVAELQFPQPLPVPLEPPTALVSPNAEQFNTWNPQLPPASPTAAPNCIWLTGTIEEPEESGALIQNASHEQEFPLPVRN